MSFKISDMFNQLSKEEFNYVKEALVIEFPKAVALDYDRTEPLTEQLAILYDISEDEVKDKIQTSVITGHKCDKIAGMLNGAPDKEIREVIPHTRGKRKIKVVFTALMDACIGVSIFWALVPANFTFWLMIVGGIFCLTVGPKIYKATIYKRYLNIMLGRR